MEFGFLTDTRRVFIDNIKIKPLNDFDETIKRFYQTAFVSNGWVYPPLVKANQNFMEKKKFKNEAKLSSNFFVFEPTHSITVLPFDDEKIKFLILAFGFLNGVYLSPAGYLCLNRIPYEISKLTGVILIKDDAEKGIYTFSEYFDRTSDEKRKLSFAILHWFLIGPSYSYDWDRFDAQYKVLDGISRLSGLSAPNHASRAVVLADKYGIKIPIWAQLSSDGKSSRLSAIRNELFHEARYAGHPIGYEYPKENFNLEFVRFNTKLIAAIFGLRSNFLQSDPNDRNQHGWGFA